MRFPDASVLIGIFIYSIPVIPIATTQTTHPLKGETMIAKVLTVAMMTLMLALGSTQLAMSASFGGCPPNSCGEAYSCLIWPTLIGTCTLNGETQYIFPTGACAFSTCYSATDFSKP
jgi:hypothetical protein